MKRILLPIWVMFGLVLISGVATAQNYPVLANATLTDTQNGQIDPNGLLQDQQVRFAVTILNMDEKQPVKNGTCELYIELGEKLQLPKDANITKATLSQYFDWVIGKDAKGNTCLTGKLKTNLPAGFEGIAYFDFACTGTGSTVLKAKWIYSNERANTAAFHTVGFTIIPKAGSSNKN